MMVPAGTDARLRRLPFAIESEIVEAANNHGYRSARGAADGWHFFASDTVPCEIALAYAATAWFLSVEHPGVAAELGAPPAAPPARGGRAAFAFADQTALRAAISRTYRLSASLPTAPLGRFAAEVASLGSTEAEAIVRRRVGQDIFRAALMDYWNGRCPLTGITDPALLRASHIVPWAACASDAERLDVHNGLLLAAHWDAAFDAGLVSFADTGEALFSPALSAGAHSLLARDAVPPLPLTPRHREQMVVHRNRVFGS